MCTLNLFRPLNDKKPQGLARVRVLFHPSIASWAEILSWNAFKTCRRRGTIVKAPYDSEKKHVPACLLYILVSAEFPGMLLTHPFKANAMKVRQEEILAGGADDIATADRSLRPDTTGANAWHRHRHSPQIQAEDLHSRFL